MTISMTIFPVAALVFTPAEAYVAEESVEADIGIETENATEPELDTIPEEQVPERTPEGPATDPEDLEVIIPTVPPKEDLPAMEENEAPLEEAKPDIPNEEPVETEAPVIDDTPEEDVIVYYDIPLSNEIQDHIYNLGKIYGIDPTLIMAMIKVESNYNPNNIGDGGNSFGYMQIQKKYHEWRMRCLNVTDLLDPFGNITVGAHILSEKIQEYGTPDKALTAYNEGDTGANRLFAQGIYANKYAKKVLAAQDAILTGNIRGYSPGQ